MPEADAGGVGREDWRGKLDRFGDKLRRAAESAAERAAREAGKAADVAGEKTREYVETGRDRIDEGYRTVTLQEYRGEVDGALADITQVLTILDAKVRELTERVEQLEADDAAEDT